MQLVTAGAEYKQRKSQMREGSLASWCSIRDNKGAHAWPLLTTLCPSATDRVVTTTDHVVRQSRGHAVPHAPVFLTPTVSRSSLRRVPAASIASSSLQALTPLLPIS